MHSTSPVHHRYTLLAVLTTCGFFVTLCNTFNRDASAQHNVAAQKPGSQSNLKYTSTVIARSLSHPWSIAFLPDTSILITERSGNLRQLTQNQLSAPISGVPPVLAVSQGGLFDVVLHPDYENNGWIYLSLAHGDANANATRVIRAKLDGNQLSHVETIFTATPYKDTPVHYGARFTFLPDNTLVLGVGDGFDFREQAQSLDNHLGKFVRIHDDGAIPSDNPFTNNGTALPEIYSLGHRNQQGVFYDSVTQRLWTHEHGPAGGDELNELAPGKNYGWPLATRGRDYSGAAISPYEYLAGTEPPLWDWTPSIAPSGMTLVTSDRFPDWQGDLLVTALKSRDVRRIRIRSDSVQEVETLFGEFGARLRDIRQGPDGALYLLTDHATNGKVIRIEPSE